MRLKDKIREFSYLIERGLPRLPEFDNPMTIVKVLFVSMILCVTYSFSESATASGFYEVFIPNIRQFVPYVVVQMTLLFLFAKTIRRQKHIPAIAIITCLNFACVFFVHFAIRGSYRNPIEDADSILDTFFTSFGILFLFLMYFDWNGKNNDPENAIAKLAFLQSKMKPHFLFNTLNSVVSLIKRNPEDAKKMLLNLSELLRHSIKKDFSSSTLKEEIELCKRYLEIEKIRLGSRLSVIWEIDEKILSCSFPDLGLQPLVENCVLHGIQSLENGGIIEIAVWQTCEEKASITIRNPFDSQRKINIQHNGISQKNLDERLKISFKGNYEFVRKASGSIYEIGLSFPMIRISEKNSQK